MIGRRGNGRAGRAHDARAFLSVALAYAFLLQTLLSLALFTQHSMAAATPDAAFFLCHGSDAGVPDPERGERQNTARLAAPCAFCAFATSGTAALPPDVKVLPLVRSFALLAQPEAPAFTPPASARSTTRLSQGPPATA